MRKFGFALRCAFGGLCFFLLYSACQSRGGAPEGQLAAAAMLPMAITDTPAPAQDTTYPIAYLLGKYDPATHPDFVLIPATYTAQKNMYLHKDAFAAYEKMYAAALNEGIVLKIRSATRTFYQQQGIWEAKWTGTRKLENGQNAAKAYSVPINRAKKILEYSAMPGTSRHHWGTDLDLQMLTNAYYQHGKGLTIYEWLRKNAATYGFCQPYTAKDKNRPSGYNEERWHWSYMPIAKKALQDYVRVVSYEHIKGFKGDETAPTLDVITHYVFGIADGCL